jgi:peptide chain release factor 2|tara:strand:- start:27 stop:965 length:939 start_codon:yes stop_codon:yes gene_type:complete
MKERSQIEDALNNCLSLEGRLEEYITLIELGTEESDDEVISDGLSSLENLLRQSKIASLEVLLSGEADRNSTYLEIHPGAGGTESQDWAEMLLRMYIRWSESKGYKVDIVEKTQGDEAGLKSVTIKIDGNNAYGWLKTESGIHRLVRISPFDSQKRRHTSFASIWIYPVIDENIEIDLKESDCRIDTFRASGAGGQHVNTTDSAVRITHIPSKIAVQCQAERSQHKNKATAWSMLRARLYEMELQKKEEDSQEQLENRSEIGWGHQIRSYVLQPYQMVKDLRTNIEDTNPQNVLNGEIDLFLSASLSQKILD